MLNYQRVIFWYWNIYVHQLRICHFLQGIWLIGHDLSSRSSLVGKPPSELRMVYFMESPNPKWMMNRGTPYIKKK